MNKARTTPYFPGQKASTCGHYYPDVMRARDRVEGQVIYRVLDCVECGRFEVPFGTCCGDPAHAGELGCDAHAGPGELDRHREAERQRLLAGPPDGSRLSGGPNS